MNNRHTLKSAFDLAVRQYDQGNFVEADKYLAAILKTFPEHAGANFYLAKIAHQRGEDDHCLNFLSKTINSKEATLEHWTMLFEVLISMKRFNEALSLWLDTEKRIMEIAGRERNHVVNLKRLILEEFSSFYQIDYSSEVQKLTVAFSKREYENIINRVSDFLKRKIDLNPFRIFRGASYAQLNQLTQATLDFEAVIVRAPQNAQALNNLGMVQLRNNDFENARKNFDGAAQIDDRYLASILTLAGSLRGADRVDDAISTYKSLLEVNYVKPEVYNDLGASYLLKNDQENALLMFMRGLELDPSFIPLLNNIAIYHYERNDTVAAEIHLKKAIAGGTKEPIIFSNMLEILEATNKLDEMSDLIGVVYRKFSPMPSELVLFEAILKYRRGDANCAVELLQGISEDKLRDKLRPKLHEYLGKSSDTIGAFDQAIKHYVKMNISAISLHPELELAGQSYLEQHRNINKLLTAEYNSSQGEDRPRSEKYFMIGFPRSGTTLLDTILSSHSLIEVLEEKPILTETREALTKYKNYNFIDEFPSFEEKQDAIMDYEQRLSQIMGGNRSAIKVIDKLPLNLLQLEFTNYLFPNSSYIMVLRHPYDSILSNWMQNFKLNPAMANMTEISTCTDLYCAAMQRYETCKRKFSMNVIEVRYENIVENFNLEIEKTLSFLKLKWEEELVNHHLIARERNKINTPSYSQVVEPLYETSKYRWRNYEALFETETEKLEPWLKKYGYLVN